MKELWRSPTLRSAAVVGAGGAGFAGANLILARALPESEYALFTLFLALLNLGFALAPETFTISELRDLYRAALGHEISATNLQRVLLRRGVLKATGERREPGPTGGRPAAVYRFERLEYQITDQFAALRPRRASTPPGARARRGRA